MKKLTVKQLQLDPEFVLYAALALLIPLWTNPSWIASTGINFLIVLAAINLKGVRSWVINLIPAFTLLLLQINTKEVTFISIISLPVLVMGNSLLWLCIIVFGEIKAMNEWNTIALGSLAKALFIFFSMGIFYLLSLLPANQLIYNFGLSQLISAFIGSSLALGAQYLRKDIFN